MFFERKTALTTCIYAGWAKVDGKLYCPECHEHNVRTGKYKLINKKRIDMERKIGEIFEYNGEWYQCVKGNGCEKCIFNKKKCYTFISDDDPIGYCEADKREDKQDVIFKKLEKIGETFSDYCSSSRIVYFQRYRCYQKPIIKGDTIWHWSDDTLIDIEIKQNEKDMEEKKLNLKPFDLEAAKAGKPVCTRDGRKARIICFDVNCSNNQPIIALITEENGFESLYSFTSEGKWVKEDSVHDLMMLPEKKEGWVNIYKYRVGGPYESKEYALKQKMGDCIDTVKVEWEE